MVDYLWEQPRYCRSEWAYCNHEESGWGWLPQNLMEPDSPAAPVAPARSGEVRMYHVRAHPKVWGRLDGTSPIVLPPQKNSSKQGICSSHLRGIPPKLLAALHGNTRPFLYPYFPVANPGVAPEVRVSNLLQLRSKLIETSWNQSWA